MRRVLAAAVLVACVPIAHAQDKGKTDISATGEFRLRDTFQQNESGNSSVEPSHENGIDQRFKLGVNFRANEKFSATATLLQSASWGQTSTESTVGDRGQSSADPNSGDERNFMSVNEAYVTWMMTDSVRAKFGRMNFAFGDGAVMSTNDYQAQPYAFDGVAVNYEVEFGKFTAFAFKYRDFSNDLPATTSDPQHDAYGLVFDLKTMPEWIKAINAHVIQDIGDAVWGQPSNPTGGSPVAATTEQNFNALRYGLGAQFSFVGLDIKGDFEGVTGKNSFAQGGSGAVSSSSVHGANQMMYQAELGYTLSGFMGSRFYVGYHQDSGTAASDQSTKDNTYDPYFYDKHTGSGLMELIAWGNLTSQDIGWTIKPTDSTDVGLIYWMFSKTKSDGIVNGGTYGQNLFGNGLNTTANNSTLGSEVDLWAEHRYEGGLSMLARAGMFMPGSALTDSTINKGSTVSQIMVQGKLSF